MTEGEFQALQRLATSQDRKPSRVLRLALDALLYGTPAPREGE